jgi:hypothetical protein
MSANEIFFQQKTLAFWHRALGWVLRRRHELLEYSQVMRCMAFAGQHDLGVRTVSVNQIVGTLGRGSDFDSAFRPLRNNMEQRWMRIQDMYDRGENFPAIELYKVGDSYFVRDGHHRVSVARANGMIYLDAWVIEVGVTTAQPVFAC